MGLPSEIGGGGAAGLIRSRASFNPRYPRPMHCWVYGSLSGYIADLATGTRPGTITGTVTQSHRGFEIADGTAGNCIKISNFTQQPSDGPESGYCTLLHVFTPLSLSGSATRHVLEVSDGDKDNAPFLTMERTSAGVVRWICPDGAYNNWAGLLVAEETAAVIFRWRDLTNGSQTRWDGFFKREKNGVTGTDSTLVFDRINFGTGFFGDMHCRHHFSVVWNEPLWDADCYDLCESPWWVFAPEPVMSLGTAIASALRIPRLPSQPKIPSVGWPG